MHIQCTNGTPMVNKLDNLPPLPLVVKYITSTGRRGHRGVTILTEQDELGIHNALRLHDRVRRIDLDLPPSILHTVLLLMDKRFPILEYLHLSFTTEKTTAPTLPNAFLAPNLGYLALPCISPPRRLRVFTSTVFLVRLEIWNIQSSSYVRPRVLVARLSSLPQLEILSIEFSVPIPRPSTERELLGEKGTPLTLPNLQTFWFKGVSAYMESVVAQIRVPRLQSLTIRLFNQIVFALPHLSHLLNITEGSKYLRTVATVQFDRDDVVLITNGQSPSQVTFFLHVECRQLDWQVDCAAQICSSFITTLSGVKELTLGYNMATLPSEWEDGGIDGTTWHELLRLFIKVRCSISRAGSWANFLVHWRWMKLGGSRHFSPIYNISKGYPRPTIQLPNCSPRSSIPVGLRVALSTFPSAALQAASCPLFLRLGTVAC
jgi:hypothetical protein